MKSNINATTSPLTRANPARWAQAALRPWNRPLRLPVQAPHNLAFRLRGNPEGSAWLLLHGGPGSACQPGMLAPLDLRAQWAIAPDQRGCGSSRPRGSSTRNHTALLVADLEALRLHLGLERWSLLAGSWGAVLALAYASEHPHRVERMVLRGAFALRRREVGGLLQQGKTPRQGRLRWPVDTGPSLPALLARLRQVLQTGTPAVAALHAARLWALRETQCAARGMWRALLHASAQAAASVPVPVSAMRGTWAALRRRERQQTARLAGPPGRHDAALRARYRIQAHYLLHRGFVRPGGLDRAVRTLAQRGVSVNWVHGRFDAVCPPANSRSWAAQGQRVVDGASSLVLPVAGHLAHEPQILVALRQAVGRA
jgi:proline iminopeptidase